MCIYVIGPVLRVVFNHEDRGAFPGIDCSKRLPQAVHTATDVPISAYSSGSKAYELFVGVQQNTDVFFKLLSAALRP